MTTSSLPEAVREPPKSTMQHCPNCNERQSLQPFYSLSGVPAHSVLLMRSRSEAINYPQGRLDLSFCNGCGFITNTAFDVRLNDYSPHYEETQHFSPRFNSFARELVDRLVTKYDVRKKTVLEIGCGKGEFLMQLCHAGNNQGIGIDPSCNPDRFDGPARSRVTFIPELYRPHHASLRADVICCRHTLEHIPATLEFLQLVRQSIRDRNTLVFFEVPDIRIILRERRFWDLYYEHCSYFGIGSLAGLFQRCGFEVVEVLREYDEQYLTLIAKPVQAGTTRTGPTMDDCDETRLDVEQFQTRVAQDIVNWKARLRQYAADCGPPVIWGAGSKCVAFLSTLGIQDEIDFVVDINPYKQGKFLPGTGHPVIAPEQLAACQPGRVVAMNSIYLDEIATSLESNGVDGQLMAA